MRSRKQKLILLMAGLLLLSSCSERSHRVVLIYPTETLFMRAYGVDLFVGEGKKCSELDTQNKPPRLHFRAHENADKLGDIAIGLVSFRAEVRDVDCSLFLSKCVEEVISAQEDSTVRIALGETEEKNCAAGTRCVSGSCVISQMDSGPALDATLDGNGGSDGSVADVLDAGSAEDAAADATPADSARLPDSTLVPDAHLPDAHLPDALMPDTMPDAAAIPDVPLLEFPLLDVYLPDVVDASTVDVPIMDAGTMEDATNEDATADASPCVAPPNYQAVFVPTSPLIDGNIGEFITAGAHPICIENVSGTLGHYYVMWNNEGLHLAAAVQDTTLNAIAGNEGILWQDDSIETFFDPLHNRGASLQSDDHKFFVNIGNFHQDSLDGNSSWNADPNYLSAVDLDGTINDLNPDVGYQIEITIPWDSFHEAIPQPNGSDQWGFDLSMNDRNNQGQRIQTSWTTEGALNIPDTWGTLFFAEDQYADACEARYSSAPGFMLCAAHQESCSFFSHLTTDCHAQCQAYGGVCLGAFENQDPGECTAVQVNTCSTSDSGKICVCTGD